MKLEANAELFRERVREAPISGNIDNPEGGFDALVQVNSMFYLISILCSGGIGVYIRRWLAQRTFRTNAT